MTNEQLVLNGPAQQVAVAGSLVPAPSSYTVAFNGASTTPIIPGFSPAQPAR